MPFCPKCGASLDRDESYCTNCGHRQTPLPQEPLPRKRRLKPVVVVAALLLTVALTVALVLLLVSRGGTWERIFGGDGSKAGYSIIETDDGNYLAAGWTDSSGAGKDVYLVKVNPKGRLLWEKNYGGAGDDVAYCAKQTADGGFVIASWSESSGSSRDIYLLKVDRAGNLEWEKTYGGDGSSAASALLLTTAGDYIVAGWREQPGEIEKQACIMAIDERGDPLWERSYGNTAGLFNGIDHAYNGGYIMAGGIENGEGFHGYIVRTDENGEMEGELVIDRSSHDMLNAVCRTDDGGFILAGESRSPVTGDMDIFVVKIDGFDNIEWELSLGVDGDSWGNAIIDAGGIYVVAGEGAYRGTLDVVAYVAGIDSTGQKQWEQTLGREGYTGGYSAIKATGGSFIITGCSSTGSEMNLYMARFRP